MIIQAPAAEPPPPAAEQLDLQPPQPPHATAPGPDVKVQDPAPQAEAAPAPDPEREPETPPEPSPPAQEPAGAEGTPGEGERLDARMEDVLSELERRYRGRRVGPDDARGEPDPTSRPRRPRPQP